jgi:hypothetical protein
MSCFGTEFVVASSEVLHEGVTADDDSCGAVGFQAAHRTRTGFQPSVVALDPIVRVLGVGDLAVLLNRAVHVPPHAGDFDVGLVNEPTPADGVAARSRRVDQQRSEALHPPVQTSRDPRRCRAPRGAPRGRDTTTRSGDTSGPPTRSPRAGTGNPRTPTDQTDALDDGEASPQDHRRPRAIGQRNSASDESRCCRVS